MDTVWPSGWATALTLLLLGLSLAAPFTLITLWMEWRIRRRVRRALKASAESYGPEDVPPPGPPTTDQPPP